MRTPTESNPRAPPGIVPPPGLLRSSASLCSIHPAHRRGAGRRRRQAAGGRGRRGSLPNGVDGASWAGRWGQRWRGVIRATETQK